MKIFVKTLDGAVATVDVESVLDYDGIRKQLAGQNSQIGPTASLILSSTEFKSEEIRGKRKPTLSHPEINLDDAPPIPKPQNSNDIPPQYSTSTIIASNANEQLLYYNSDGNVFVTVQDIQNVLNVSPTVQLNPPLPTYSLAYRCRWMQTDYQRITGPQNFQYTATTTEGMSQSDQQTFSEQLGVSLNGLSAGLSQTFSTTIEISNSNTVQHQYTIDVPAGKVWVWILWQLIYEVVAVDGSGNQIGYHGEITMDGQHVFWLALASTRATQGTSAYAPDPTPFDS